MKPALLNELRSDKALGHDRKINTRDATLKNIEDKENELNF